LRLRLGKNGAGHLQVRGPLREQGPGPCDWCTATQGLHDSRGDQSTPAELQADGSETLITVAARRVTLPGGRSQRRHGIAGCKLRPFWSNRALHLFLPLTGAVRGRAGDDDEKITRRSIEPAPQTCRASFGRPRSKSPIRFDASNLFDYITLLCAASFVGR